MKNISKESLFLSTNQDREEDESNEAYQETQFLLRRLISPEIYYRLRTFNRRYPWLFLPFARWRWQRWRKKHSIDSKIAEPAAPQPFDKNTEIVIEAYPRCGNTFAHIAFKFAQDRTINIAHHTHAAAQVIAGAKNRVPTLVIIRPPEDAIISYLVGGFDPGLTIKQSLREYISFYSLILPYCDRFILATFSELIGDFGVVIQQINQTYNTNFKEFEHTEANVQKCFDLIDEGYETTFGEISDKTVCRPTSARLPLKKYLREQFYGKEVDYLRNKAENIYIKLISQSKLNN